MHVEEGNGWRLDRERRESGGDDVYADHYNPSSLNKRGAANQETTGGNDWRFVMDCPNDSSKDDLFCCSRRPERQHCGELGIAVRHRCSGRTDDYD